MISFVSWLKKQRKRPDPIGDLAREVTDCLKECVLAASPELRSIGDVRAHMESHSAYGPALDALDDAVEEYSRGKVALEERVVPILFRNAP